VGAARHLGKPVPTARRKRAVGGHADGRFYSRQSTPLGIGRKRGEQKQAVGRSRGGRNTKIHALADAKGRLIAILLTGGQAHDCPVARRLIDRVEPAERLLGDKAYDGNELRDKIGSAWNQACHSQPHEQEVPIPLQQTPLQDALAHRECVQQAQGLQTYRDPLRQARAKLFGFRLPCRSSRMVDLMSLDPS
jgi:transposase